MKIPRGEWKWYGFPGHYMYAHRCSYHLNTRIGAFLISTVGAMRNETGDAYAPLLFCGESTFFETLVFDCDGEDKFGNPILKSMSAIDEEYYSESMHAERGHYKMCDRYAEGKGI